MKRLLATLALVFAILLILVADADAGCCGGRGRQRNGFFSRFRDRRNNDQSASYSYSQASYSYSSGNCPCGPNCPCPQQPAAKPEAAPAPTVKPMAGKSEVTWLPTYADAYETAKRDCKPLVVYFTTTNCVPCQLLEIYTFAHPAVQSVLRQSACVKINAESRPDLVEQFRVTNYPNVGVFRPDGKLIAYFSGPVYPPEKFAAAVAAALSSVDTPKPGASLALDGDVD